MLKIEEIERKSKKISEVVDAFNDEFINKNARTDVPVLVQKSKLGNFYNGFFDEIFNTEYFSIFDRKNIAEYREKIDSILFENDSHYDVDFHVRRNGDIKKSGRCFRDGNNVKVYAEIGEYLGCDILKSSFSEIKGVVHEIAHATSQKFTGQDSQEKETLVGEIESMFMEKLFVRYCLENMQKVKEVLVKQESKEIPDDQAEDFVFDMFVNVRFLDLQKRAKTCGSKITPQNEKEQAFRYVVGEVYSTVLYNNYLNDPERTIKKFVKYMKNNAEYNLDESARALELGNSMNEVFSKFENELSIDEELRK